MEKTPNEFDEKARAWDDDPDRSRRARAIADAIAQELPIDPSFTALEFGCGTGLLSFPLRSRFSRITLVDSSAGMLEVLREKIERSGVTNMDAVNVDLVTSPAALSRTFSVVYSSLVLHHISDVNKILATWHGLLDRPGYLCIADLDSDGGLFHGQGFTGHNGFDRKELEAQAAAAGFLDVRFRTVCEITKAAKDGVVRTFPVFLMVARKA